MSAGRELMAYRADLMSLQADKANGYMRFKTFHTGTEIIAPAASLVFIVEPENEAAQVAFQEKDQIFP